MSKICFEGECYRVSLMKRGEKDEHILVKIEVEDDENWFEKDCFSSYWLDELISLLSLARDYMNANEENDPSGYGKQFKDK